MNPMSDPVTTIVAELVARLSAPAFSPFDIVMSDGGRVSVPTADHCIVTRILRRIEVEHDDGSISILSPLHISRIETRSAA